MLRAGVFTIRAGLRSPFLRFFPSKYSFLAVQFFTLCRLCLGSLQQSPGPRRSTSQNAGTGKGSTRLENFQICTVEGKNILHSDIANIDRHSTYLKNPRRKIPESHPESHPAIIGSSDPLQIPEASTGATLTAHATRWISEFRALTELGDSKTFFFAGVLTIFT